MRRMIVRHDEKDIRTLRRPREAGCEDKGEEETFHEWSGVWRGNKFCQAGEIYRGHSEMGRE